MKSGAVLAFSLFAEVALDLNISKLLTYGIPEELLEHAKAGARVSVHIRGHLRKGTIVETKSSSDLEKIHPVEQISPQNFDVSHDLLELAKWISTYYITPLSRVLDTILPRHVKEETEVQKELWIARGMSREKLAAACASLRRTAPKQANVLERMLRVKKGIFAKELLEEARASRSCLDALVEKKLLISESVEKNKCPLESAEFFPSKPKKLNPEQQEVLDAIAFGVFCPYLIHGVTGSGKTEVYCQAIQKVLERGESVIVLVPEIALTHQSAERFHSRFPGLVALQHHRLSHGERLDQYRRIARGERRIILGPRSALFAPVQNLGLIIVDEEHDSSYKSSEMPALNARDAAIMRAKITKSPILLGSATPSLESYQNALAKKYKLLNITQRAAAEHPAKVHVVDMSLEFAKYKKYVLFSDLLLRKIEEKIKKSEQVILFLNRRGYHSHMMCMSCGEAIHCPACSITLTFHKGENKLACHLCGHEEPLAKECPHCKSNEQLKFKGIGTELVESTLRALLPNVKTIRMDADTTRTKKAHEEILRTFRSGKADILIGTQMIAKGLDIPSVTLAAVLSCDMSLQLPDFRASESTFQLIAQVAGRSGRGKSAGEVILQSHMPKHEVIQAAAAGDFVRFYTGEIETREILHFPPFTKIVRLLFKGKEHAAVWNEASRIFRELQQKLSANYTLHPVSDSGYGKIGEMYRVHFFIRGGGHAGMREVLKALKTPSSIRLTIDVDPTSLF